MAPDPGEHAQGMTYEFSPRKEWTARDLRRVDPIKQQLAIALNAARMR